MQTFKKLFFLLSAKEQKHAFLLLLMTIMMTLLDMMGIVSILPFIGVLANPSLIETNNILNTMFEISIRLGVETKQEFLFFLGLIVFLILITSITFKALTVYIQNRFIRMREYSISKRLIEGYLNQPYSWFLSRNSAELGKTILSEVGAVIASGMSPLIELISNSILIIVIISLLTVVNSKLVLIVSLSLGFSYLFIFYFVRRYISLIGEERFRNNKLRFTAVMEAFGAVKEVKVQGLEKIYIDNFSNPAKIFAKAQASSAVVAQLTRFILEAVAFGGILLMILYMVSKNNSLISSLPVIALYVFAGYRLLPALQKLYLSFTQITFISPSINKLHDDFKNLKPQIKPQEQEAVLFDKEITLNHISYDYPNSSRTALKDINLTIKAKSRVGLIGSTGCGKTTTVDIILGLLEPKKGTLKVDGKVIKEQNLKAWQQLIGYVPQHIYLSDNTIMANIAFGEEFKNINQDRIKKVSKIAKLHNFVIDELPNQYQTIVGERGIRLSGGQLQRIGIARALYHNPKILIFDEATSALDNQTEQEVMNSVDNLSNDLTIILIAHRLNTVKNCDIIFLLDKGQLKDKGKFVDIIKNKNIINKTT